ncbi:tetratricopeptide repeat protein [Tardiphaga alba]|uniref:Tetratricopeptide repeat protein n=1 Tax=Tardiphaga alba TaxID=340268 RepID=A0ABX8ABU7_9BRAD|nr:tetratricopeptide repeat protein [Tardiphaga alba]QUS40967.1 tetratricopeptide repeat protein [Tardiphaga alba]
MVLTLSTGFSLSAFAQSVKGTAALSTSGGYARIVLKLAEDVESEVSQAGSVVIVRFKRPVDVPVEILSDAAPDYVGSARRDPDGTAIRLALSRRVTVNSMTAGERVFIDLLPDGWKGAPPGLPQDVVKELSERARAAERALRQQRASADLQKKPPIRVRTSVQPTFVRFMFETPPNVSVSSLLDDKRLTMTFGAALVFDLADAKLSAPANVASIGQAMDGNRTAVEIGLIGDVDVKSFRDDKNYIVDIGFQQTDKPSPLAQVPPATPKAPEPKPAEPVPAKASEIKPPTSETIARETAGEKRGEAPAIAPVATVEAPKVEAPKVEAAKSEAMKPEAVTVVEAAPAAAPVVAVAPKEPPPPAPATPPPSPAVAAPTGIPVEIKRSSEGTRMTFAFPAPTPVALFRRGDMLWLVTDSTKPIDTSTIRRDSGSIVADADAIKLDKGQAVRMRLNRPQLASLAADDAGGNGQAWVLTLADTRQVQPQPLSAVRNIADPSKASVQVPLSKPGLKHRITDPDAGDLLTVITALPPARGFIRRQDFVEFSLLESVHGVVVQTNSDDVAVDANIDKVILTKPGGLTLSPADAAPQRASTVARPIFDVGQWRIDQEGPFKDRYDKLIDAAATADTGSVANARLDLAKFYMARGMYHEAKGVADLAISDMKVGEESPAALVVHAVASALIGRPEQTLKDIAQPVLGPGYDAELWKAFAFAKQGKWVEARERFKNSEFTLAALPADLQRAGLMLALRASLEVKDYASASARGSELEVVGITPELKPAATMLSGWLDEALGREKDALSKYSEVTNSVDRLSASEAKLREILLRQKRNEISDEDALKEFETLAITWRGDGIEVRVLQLLSQMYAKLGRYQESLMAARTATERQANSEAARQVQDDAQALFSEVYLSPKGDNLPPVEALAMFYEFRELTPIGRRGDEMIRRLADRLVAVDLLDQAAELLQYQVDHRLEGAARAQVAARLATVYLMARKPDRAIAAMRTTRIADLSGELRQQRLLLEARAQSDIGRRELALDIISHVAGREAVRLRSDIYWSSRRWREAAEQIELYYGDRWRDFTPLTDSEKSDVIRAVVGYAIADDALGLARFREKYAPLMNTGADKIAFDTASKPNTGNSSEFAAIAKMAASVDTLDGFLREMKQRFPDSSAKATVPGMADMNPTGSLPSMPTRPVVKVRKIEMTR